MTEKFDIGHEYYQALTEIVEAVPRTSFQILPQCIVHPSFVISCCDEHGSVTLELISRHHAVKIRRHGFEFLASNDGKPRFLNFGNVKNLNGFLFPGAPDGTLPSITFKHSTVMHGIHYASEKFHENNSNVEYQSHFTVGEVPFCVDHDGALLLLNVAYGHMINGGPTITEYEWLRLIGSDLLPSFTKSATRELAFNDFSSSIFNFESKTENLGFDQFLAGLREPVDTQVLLLGPYNDESKGRFKEVETVLKQLGYHPFLLKDANDLPIQTNIEKLVAGVMFSAFVVIIDEQPSGHIAETEKILSLNMRPSIVIRGASGPSTTFLDDSILLNENFQVVHLEKVTSAALADSVIWAREWLETRETKLNGINSWRK